MISPETISPGLGVVGLRRAMHSVGVLLCGSLFLV